LAANLALRVCAAKQQLSDPACAGHHLDGGAVVIDTSARQGPASRFSRPQWRDTANRPAMQFV